MKIIRLKALRNYNLIITTLMAMLGFATACDDIIDPKMEYGTPSADFIVKGKVTSKSTGEVVPYVKVVMRADTTPINDVYHFGCDSVMTDANGNYETIINDFPGEAVFKLHVEDVDGSVNGSYQSFDTTFTFTDPQYTGGDGWYEGKTTQELNIELVTSNKK